MRIWRSLLKALKIVDFCILHWFDLNLMVKDMKWLQGIAFFDASIAGLGGCPYSPGATGNTPTEDVVYLCRQMGVETGIDLEKLCDISELVRTFSGKLPPSAYYRATRVKQTDGLVTT